MATVSDVVDRKNQEVTSSHGSKILQFVKDKKLLMCDVAFVVFLVLVVGLYIQFRSHIRLSEEADLLVNTTHARHGDAVQGITGFILEISGACGTGVERLVEQTVRFFWDLISLVTIDDSCDSQLNE